MTALREGRKVANSRQAELLTQGHKAGRRSSLSYNLNLPFPRLRLAYNIHNKDVGHWSSLIIPVGHFVTFY